MLKIFVVLLEYELWHFYVYLTPSPRYILLLSIYFYYKFQSKSIFFSFTKMWYFFLWFVFYSWVTVLTKVLSLEFLVMRQVMSPLGGRQSCTFHRKSFRKKKIYKEEFWNNILWLIPVRHLRFYATVTELV